MLNVNEIKKAIESLPEKDFIWIWIGTHDEYERMIK
jgi:hypothetical protein